MNLEKYRELSGKSIQSAAAACGVSYTMMRRYETGAARPSVNTLLTLSNVYGVDPFKLAGVYRLPNPHIYDLANLIVAADKMAVMPLVTDRSHYEMLKRVKSNIAESLSILKSISESIENYDRSSFICPESIDYHKELVECLK